MMHATGIKRGLVTLALAAAALGALGGCGSLHGDGPESVPPPTTNPGG